jgi:signal peptidase I
MPLKNLSLRSDYNLKEKTSSANISEIDKLNLFEELLNSGLDLRLKVTGKSMEPFLKGGEIVTLKKVPYTSLRKGDLIFFKDHNGFPVLHRFITKKRINQSINAFQARGDAAIIPDDPVSEDNLLGKVYEIEKTLSSRRTRHIEMESPLWKSINYLIVIIGSVKSKIYFAVFR